MIFLAIFTMVVLTKLDPIYSFEGMTIVELFCWSWSITIFIEELRQVKLFKINHYAIFMPNLILIFEKNLALVNLEICLDPSVTVASLSNN